VHKLKQPIVILATLVNLLGFSLNCFSLDYSDQNSFSKKTKEKRVKNLFDTFEYLVFALADDSFAINWKRLEDKSKKLIKEVSTESQREPELKTLENLSKILYKFSQAGNLFYEQNQDPEISARLMKESLKELRETKVPKLKTKDTWGREKIYSLKEAISNLDNLINSNLQYLEENFGT